MGVKIKVRQNPVPSRPGIQGQVDKATQLRKAAEDAVQAFEHEANNLSSMREEFQQAYPDAVDALEAIKQQEDVVAQTIADAKSKVAAAKITIGDFLCKRAFSQPGYDDDRLTEILMSSPQRAELFELLVEAGVIKSVNTDRQAAAVFAAQNPKDSAPLQTAWEDKKELTPRVSVPKVG